LLLAFVPSAVMKLVHAELAVEGFGKMGIPEGALIPIGIVELICLAIFLVPRTVVLGAFLLTGYLGGATMANIVGGTDFIHALVIGLMAWTVAWLRTQGLRELLPVAQSGWG
jgi:hypothetical protein